MFDYKLNQLNCTPQLVGFFYDSDIGLISAKEIKKVKFPYLVKVSELLHTEIFVFVNDILARGRYMTESVASKLFHAIAVGFKELQLNNIVHRDIKLDNMMLAKVLTHSLTHSLAYSLIHLLTYLRAQPWNQEQDNVVVKIIDFALSCVIPPGKTGIMEDSASAVGNKLTRAPEVTDHNLYSHASDIYSLGFVLFSIVTG